MSKQKVGTEKTKPTLGVIIPTNNAEPTLGAVLRALGEGACLFDMDIILADGGSEDRTVEIAQRHDLRVLEAEGGWPAQVTAAAQVTWGQWVMLLGGDIVLRAGWSSTLRLFVDTTENRDFAAYGRFQDQTPTPFSFLRGIPAMQSGLVMRRVQLERLLQHIRPEALTDRTMATYLDRRRLVRLPYLLHRMSVEAADAA